MIAALAAAVVMAADALMLVFACILFAILLVVLRIFLWGPILKMLDERKQRIEEGLRASEAAASAAEQSQVAARAALEDARAEGRDLVARAQETAARLGTELEQQAQAEEADEAARRAKSKNVMSVPGDAFPSA